MERLVDIMAKERENYENTVLEVGAEVETTIDELIEEYKGNGKFYNTETYRMQDKIDALEELKKRLML
jgi:molybdopterin converting factor small subunit